MVSYLKQSIELVEKSNSPETDFSKVQDLLAVDFGVNETPLTEEEESQYFNLL